MKPLARMVIGTSAVVCSVGVFGMPTASATGLSITPTTNFAGYQATDPVPVTSFSGTLTLPAVTCPATGSLQFSEEVSLYGASAGSASFSLGGQCYNGSSTNPSASASIGLFGGAQAFGGVGAATGQPIKVTFTSNSGTNVTSFTLKNLTTLATSSGSVPTALALTGIQAGLSIFGYGPTPPPVPTFTKATLTGLKFNGATLATLSPTESEIYNGPTLQVATSAISAGGSFSAIFKHV